MTQDIDVGTGATEDEREIFRKIFAAHEHLEARLDELSEALDVLKWDVEEVTRRFDRMNPPRKNCPSCGKLLMNVNGRCVCGHGASQRNGAPIG